VTTLSSIFDQNVANEFKDITYQEERRELGKTRKYDIGTTAMLTFGDYKYFLFASSKTDDEYKAYSTPSLLLFALEGLWKKARTECNGYPISVPLLGTGLSKVGLPPMRIIELLLISILNATKEREITSEINIVVYHNFFEEVNLDFIYHCWR
jgi:hypothetical protein